MKRTMKTLAFVAVLALCLTGGATAASKITSRQIKDGSITGRDIKNRSIKAADIGFYTGDGAGPVTTVESQEVTLLPGQSTYEALGGGNFAAACPSGMGVIGTGFDAGIGNVAFVQSYESFVGGFIFNDTTVDFTVKLQAICAYAHTSASVTRTAGSARTDLERFKRAELAAERQH